MTRHRIASPPRRPKLSAKPSRARPRARARTGTRARSRGAKRR